MVAVLKTARRATAEAAAEPVSSLLNSSDRHFQTHFTVLKYESPRLDDSTHSHAADSATTSVVTSFPSSVQLLQGTLFINGKPVNSTTSIEDKVIHQDSCCNLPHIAKCGHTLIATQ